MFHRVDCTRDTDCQCAEHLRGFNGPGDVAIKALAVFLDLFLVAKL
jgi:hypothetical protein